MTLSQFLTTYGAKQQAPKAQTPKAQTPKAQAPKAQPQRKQAGPDWRVVHIPVQPDMPLYSTLRKLSAATRPRKIYKLHGGEGWSMIRGVLYGFVKSEEKRREADRIRHERQEAKHRAYEERKGWVFEETPYEEPKAVYGASWYTIDPAMRGFRLQKHWGEGAYLATLGIFESEEEAKEVVESGQAVNASTPYGPSLHGE